MGTKNNPGKLDCYHNAEPDEPMFILLARDRHAPALVRLWSERAASSGASQEKVMEARACADAMEEWRWENRVATDPDLLVAAALFMTGYQPKTRAQWLDLPKGEQLEYIERAKKVRSIVGLQASEPPGGS